MTTITKEWLQQTIAEFENTRDDIPFGLDDDDAKILIVLKRALASLEREQVRHEHAEWSDATFGNVGPVGPLKHLSKEALEAAADPSDPLEWADMQFLLWDAQRRMGISDEFITRAMIEKLEINKSRQWPEPKDGEPRLHIKEQPAPVVRQIMRELVHLLDEDQFARIENIALSAGVMPPQLAPVVPEEIEPDDSNTFDYVDGWNACRAAMLQAGNHTEQHLDMVDHSGDANEKGSDGTFIDEGTKQAGNSPVIPDGWVSCSERMPEQGAYISAVSKHGEYVAGQVIDDWLDLHDGTSFGLDEVYLWMMLPPLPAPPQQ